MSIQKYSAMTFVENWFCIREERGKVKFFPRFWRYKNSASWVVAVLSSIIFCGIPCTVSKSDT